MQVLVGGPPASGKSTLAAALAGELGLPLLSKDVVKDALMAALGAPRGRRDVPPDRACRGARRAARTARAGSVIDSTWFDYARPVVPALPGPVIEVRCELDEAEALRRYAARSAAGRGGHLDALRTREELRDPALLAPLGVGPVLRVDTSAPVDVRLVAAEIRRLAAGAATCGDSRMGSE